jgi:hypothetical protein
MGGACSTNGDGRGVYRVFVEKPEIRRPLGRPRHRWEGNVEMDLPEVRRGAWTRMIWLRKGTGGGHM